MCKSLNVALNKCIN